MASDIPGPNIQITDLPDELLLKIFTFVPYSSTQHLSLRLVSKRFQSVVDTPALRLRVTEQQFPIYAELFSFNKIDRGVLSDFRNMTTEVISAANEVLGNRDDSFLLEVLKSGIYLLDFVSMVSGTLYREASENAQLLRKIATDSLGNHGGFVMRMTIHELLNYFRERDRSLENSLMQKRLPAMFPPTICKTIDNRAFEAAILIECTSSIQSLLQGGLTDSMRDYMAGSYITLSSFAVYSSELSTHVYPESIVKLLHGSPWNILSNVMFPEKNRDTECSESLMEFWMKGQERDLELLRLYSKAEKASKDGKPEAPNFREIARTAQAIIVESIDTSVFD